MINGTWHASITEPENNTMYPIYIMHLEKHELGLNTIISKCMRYNGPSLKKWVGRRVEQPENPC